MKTLLYLIPMKVVIILILFLATLAVIHRGGGPKSLNVANTVNESRDFFAVCRSGIGKSMEKTLKHKIITSKDLGALLEVVSYQTNQLSKAMFIQKLDAAARMVELVRTQSPTLLNEPANKQMAQGDDLQGWLEEVSIQRSICEITGNDLAGLRGTLHELLRWTVLMESVAPPDQVSNKLKPRLVEILNAWIMPPHKLPPSADVQFHANQTPPAILPP